MRNVMRWSLVIAIGLSLPGCGGEESADATDRESVGAGAGRGAESSEPEAPKAKVLLHLDELLDEAQVTGSQPATGGAAALSWEFPADSSEWRGKAAAPRRGTADPQQAPRVEPVEDAARVHLEHERDGQYWGYFTAAVPDLARTDWTDVRVKLRTGSIESMTLAFNLEENGRPVAWGDQVELETDGEVHDYRLRVNSNSRWQRRFRGPWSELVLAFVGDTAGSVDVMSVSITPRSQEFANETVQVRSIARGGRDQRRAIAFHTPGEIAFTVAVPEGGRLDAGIGALTGKIPVAFEVKVRDENGAVHDLAAATAEDESEWGELNADLAEFAGQEIQLILAGTSEPAGTVGFWVAPTVSGERETTRPNVILYVIDGGGADLMSLYGYERDTTPTLKKLAAEGTVFEYAHTNSGWTKSSTSSFMTSLHHSVLGGFSGNSDQIPQNAVTMATRFRNAGYQTAVFTSNPFAGSLNGLQRDVDVFRDRGADHNSASSVELQREFWEWRDSWPGEPYWVHIQTTDVHEPHEPVPPYAETWVTPEERERFESLFRQMRRSRGRSDNILGRYRQRLIDIGVDPKEFFNIQRGLYDETMLHNDYQIGELVKGLKERGEWEHTLLIIASDHGHPAGSFSRFGRGLIEPPPEEWEGALADSFRTRIPLMMFWPGRIPAGKRIEERVSMIDLLPTLLELTGLPQPEILQGRSMVKLIDGDPDWKPIPIIFDQFQADTQTGEMAGHIEMIEGKWAASLEIVPESFAAEYRAGRRDLVTEGGWRAARPHRASTPSLLLYDLSEDPFCTTNVNAENEERVEEFTQRLLEQWASHVTLAQHFSSNGAEAMTEEQLETLRALGYIR